MGQLTFLRIELANQQYWEAEGEENLAPPGDGGPPPPDHGLPKKKPGTKPKPPKPQPPKELKRRPRQVRLKLPKKRGRKKNPEDPKEPEGVPMEEEVCELRDPEQAVKEGETGLLPEAKPKGRPKRWPCRNTWRCKQRWRRNGNRGRIQRGRSLPL